MSTPLTPSHTSVLQPAFNPYSAGADFRRQNLTSKVGPNTERIKKLSLFIIMIMAQKIDIQMKQNELTKPFT